MAEKKIWISEAHPEEKGSFTDIESGICYHNVNDFDKEVKVTESLARGEEPIEVDAPPPGQTYSPDQRHNLYYAEEDGQGMDYPRRYGPGR